MGLDAVELLLATEEEFAIDIPNAVAERLTTPRRMAEYIYGQRAGIPQRCRSMLAFHRVRTVLMRVAGVPRDAVQLDTPLSALFRPGRPYQQWQAAWAALACGSPPALAFSGRRVCQVAVVACVFTLVMLVLVTGSECASWSGATAIVVCVWSLALQQTTRLAAAYADRIPVHLDSVRSLVGQVYLPMPADESVGFKLILARVMAITAEQLGVEPGTFSPDARFVQDLGLD